MTDRATTLASLYERELQPIATELEQQRRNIRQRAMVVGLGLFGGTAILLLLSLIIVPTSFFFFLAFGLIALAVVAWNALMNGAFQNYRRSFKDNVITRLVKLVDESLLYAPGQGISRDEFRASQLYTRDIDRYNREDLFYGMVGATDIRFSEVHAEYKQTTTDSKGNTTTTYHTIFKGIFFIGDFHKDFLGQTIVMPSGGSGLLADFGRTLQNFGTTLIGQGDRIVQLEDPEFMQLFSVRSTDQVEARYILSTSLMRRLIEFRTRLNTPIAVSFINSNIYIAIPTTKDHFEPPGLWSGNAQLSMEQFETYLEDIRLAAAIVEDLNLNTRIWSKQ
ncbi:DUF3137 domain-containing protein [Candidatus Chloroploca asiatica]|uniref:Galanin n=1 Tax=Candidatus Chloroploca asiatica TaxID=1506545 RepID=A0A2H3LA25_9CHLR|nr:DUF3137 domain-containing protein [Candidatus Chloroploca asiatica]PDV99194.1 hypothetical protein A9Q02_13370 [Candidatus Chloroploca asiatica]